MQEAIKLFFVEFICVYFVQSIIFVSSLCIFTDAKVGRQRFIQASVIFMLGTILIRMLPIHFGVHTPLSLLFLILIGTIVLEIPVYPAIKATLAAAVILLVVESANVLVLTALLGQAGFNRMVNDRYLNSLFGLPANLLFLVAVSGIYLLKRRRLCSKEKKGVASTTDKKDDTAVS